MGIFPRDHPTEPDILHYIEYLAFTSILLNIENPNSRSFVPIFRSLFLFMNRLFLFCFHFYGNSPLFEVSVLFQKLTYQFNFNGISPVFEVFVLFQKFRCKLCSEFQQCCSFFQKFCSYFRSSIPILRSFVPIFRGFFPIFRSSYL